MQDNDLRLTKPIYQHRIDTGGMFDDTLAIFKDPDDSSLPYLALATGSWGAGYGRRYSTKKEAMDNLERLHTKLH